MTVSNVKVLLLQHLINLSDIFGDALTFMCYNMNGIACIFKLTDAVVIVDVLRDNVKVKLLRMLKVGCIVQQHSFCSTEFKA